MHSTEAILFFGVTYPELTSNYGARKLEDRIAARLGIKEPAQKYICDQKRYGAYLRELDRVTGRVKDDTCQLDYFGSSEDPTPFVTVKKRSFSTDNCVEIDPHMRVT